MTIKVNVHRIKVNVHRIKVNVHRIKVNVHRIIVRCYVRHMRAAGAQKYSMIPRYHAEVSSDLA